MRIPTRRTAGPLIHRVTIILWVLSFIILVDGLLIHWKG